MWWCCHAVPQALWCQQALWCTASTAAQPLALLPCRPGLPQEWNFGFEEPSSGSSCGSSRSGSNSSQANLAAAKQLMQQAHVAMTAALPARALQRRRPAQPAHHPADWQFAAAVRVDGAVRRIPARVCTLALLFIAVVTAWHRTAFP